MLFTALLFVHSLLRWLLVLAGLSAVGMAFAGLRRKSAVSPAEGRAALVFTIALDTQVLLGLVLYVRDGSVARAAMASGAAAMKDGTLRFWLVEHPFSMLAALVLAHVGRVLFKRAPDDAVKHRRVLVFTALALAAILAGMPWPFTAHGRPLLPHG